MTREEVYRQAVKEHSTVRRDEIAPRVTPYSGTKEYSHTEYHAAGAVYHFGLYWPDQPARRCVVTYGPRVIFRDGKIVGYDPNAYECWAS